MPWWIVALLAAVLLLAPWGAVRHARGSVATSSPQTEVTVKKIKSLSQSELVAMLGRVKTSQAPEPRIGALCYETVTIYERVEYICPHCGEKTLYPRSPEADKLLDLQELEREFSIFRKKSPLKMDIEEYGYCKHCDSGRGPQGAALVVTYEDGSTHRCFPFTIQDLNKLKALLTGKLLWDAGNENQFVLSEQIPRLEELLGVKLDKRQ